MNVVDLSDPEKQTLHQVLLRIINGMNTSEDEKAVARKFARQLMGARVT